MEACKRHRVGSVVAFPISIDNARVGVLTVAADDCDAFGPEETNVGTKAATRAASILNAHGARPRANNRACIDEPEQAFKSLLTAVYQSR